MTDIKLSFIILNYKTKHLLRLAVKNLLSLNLTVPSEIIVVDNASGDGSVAMMQKYYPKIKLIASPTNTGHAKGNNLGIKEAKGDYIVIMNSDVIFLNPADLSKLCQYLDDHPDIALLGPKLTNGDGSIQSSCFRPYSKLTPLYRRTPLGKLAFAKQDLANHLMVDFDHQSVREVDWLLGAVLVARKSVLDTVGALQEDFFLYFADFELCDRIRAHGYKVIYYPDVSIVHYHRRESAQHSFWGGFGSLLNYTTRIHIKDWLTYLKLAKQGYGKNS
ncbi:MAG: glycosyltransferase family 2 protein [Patescibacteria group bacterium]|jgi:hypothetical protein